MATQVQIRGAAAGTQNARTLAARELDVDTTNNRIAVHNGSRAGGWHAPNFSDVQNQAFTYIGATGTNAITATYSPAPSAYVAGQSFKFRAAATNTGAVTININGLGAKSILKRDKSSGTLIALVAGDLINGGVYTIDYDGTQFQLLADASAVSGGASFKARYTSGLMAALNNTYAKIPFETEDYDIGASFDNATNYRYQTLNTGYYQFTANVKINCSANLRTAYIAFYFNGAELNTTSSYMQTLGTIYFINLTAQINMALSTDYVEVFAKLEQGSGAQIQTETTFSGFKILGV